MPIPPSALRHASVLLLAGALACPAVSAQAQQAPNMPPPAVTVKTLQPQDVTITVTLPGRVVASGMAEVRPQVGGILLERLFEEGASVEEGEALYRIDPASYEAQVAAARAQVAQAQANLFSARKEAERIVELSSRKVVSEQNMDSAVAARQAAEAALQIAQAQLLTSEINLDRSTIRAPLSGTIGRSLTTKGALVTAGPGAPLAVIRTLDPIHVDVSASAATLIRWRRGLQDVVPAGANPTVTLTLADGGGYDHTGDLTAAEPYVDPQTGLVQVRMTFPNPDDFLLPGMYVQVEVPAGVAEGAILAPQSAVGRDRKGAPTALVVNGDGIVESRKLTVLQDIGTNWVVTEGLAAGDRIILTGVQKVAVGGPATPQEDAAPAAQN